MRKFAVLSAVLIAATALPASAAVIVNGSFEDGIDPGGFTTVGTGQTNITGWDVTSGSVDYIGGYWQAQDGRRSVDLSGNAIGTLSQTLSTVIGQTYVVTYWVSKNPDGGEPTRTGNISAGGTTGAFAYSAANNAANMNWAQQSFQFTATGTSTVLSFSSDASGGCCYGPALDNVSIAGVPEASAWALMIAGFGVVGGALRRSNRRRAALNYA